MATYTITQSAYDASLWIRFSSQGGDIDVSSSLAGQVIYVPNMIFKRAGTVVAGLGSPLSIIYVSPSYGSNNIWRVTASTVMKNLAFHSGSSLLVSSTGSLSLQNVVVKGAVTLTPGATLTTTNTSFTSATPIILSDWVGSTAGVFDGLKTATVVQGASVHLGTMSGEVTLTALPWSGGQYTYDGTLSSSLTLTLESGANLHCNGECIRATLIGKSGSLLSGTVRFDAAKLQGDLTLASGATIAAYGIYPFSIGSGTTLTCLAGSTLNRDVVVQSGGVLRLNGAQVNATIKLAPGARLEGSGSTFTATTPIILSDWSGSSKTALAGLSGSTFASGACIRISGSGLGGDATLELPAGVNLPFSLETYVSKGETLTVASGVTLSGVSGSALVENGGTLVCESGASLSGALTLRAGATLKINSASQISSLSLERDAGSILNVNGVTSIEPYTVTLTSGDYLKSGSVARAFWLANTSGGSVFPILFDESLEGQTVTVSKTSASAGTLILSNANASMILREGMTLKSYNAYSGNELTFRSRVEAHYKTKATAIASDYLTVNTTAGVLDLINASISCSGSVNVYSGGSIKMQGGDLTTKSLVLSGSSSDLPGMLEMQGGALTVESGEVGAHASLTLTGTTVKGELESLGKLSLKGVTVDSGDLDINGGTAALEEVTLAAGDINLNGGSVVLEKVTMAQGADGSSPASLVVASAARADIRNSQLGNVTFYGQGSITNTSLSGALRVNNASDVSCLSNITFLGQDTLRLDNGFTGSTATLWSGNWYKLTQKESYTIIGAIGNSASSLSIITIGAGPAGMSYRIDGSASIATGSVVTLADGVGVDMRGGNITISGMVTSRNTTVTDVFFSTRETAAHSSGHHLTITGSANVTITQGNILLDSEGGKLVLNSASSLNMTGGTLSVADSISVGYRQKTSTLSHQAATLTLTGTNITSPNLDGSNGVVSGVVMNIRGEAVLEQCSVAASSTLKVASYSYQRSVVVSNTILYFTESGAGSLNMRNTTIGKEALIEVAQGASLTMEGCSFDSSGSNYIQLMSGAKSVSITNCDLRGVTLIIKAQDAPIDLSGNYWGTTDINTIRASIIGDAGDYVINDVLSSAPVVPTLDTTAPTRPSSLKAALTQEGKKVVLSWSASTDPSGVTYELAYKLDTASDFTTLTGLTYTARTIDLSASGKYEWRVRAIDGKGNATAWVSGSSFSNSAASTDTTPPTKPSSLKFGLTQSGKQAVLSWSASTDPSGVTYELAYKATSASDFTTLTGLTYTAKTVDLPTSGYYNWKVRAKDGAGNYTAWVWGSSFNATVASEDKTPPSSPGSLKASVASGSKQVVLSWAASTDPSGVTYELAYKATSASDYTTLTGLTSTSKTVNLPTSGYYNWRVRAKDGKGNYTVWVWGSSFQVAAADTTPPTKPASLKFGLTQGGKQAVLSWSASTDPSGVTYELAYKHTSASDFTTLTGLTYTAKTIDLSGAGYYNWKVRAKDGKGNCTAWVWGSSFQVAAVDTTPPTKPASLKFGLTQGGKQAVLSWAASTDASGVTYELAYKAATESEFTTLTGLTYTAKTIDLPLTGYYNWKIRAVDGKGNATAWVWGSSFNNKTAVSADTTPPTKPTNLKFGLTQQGQQAVLSWSASTDASGVTYELAYKHTSASDFTTLTGLTYTAKTIDLSGAGYYNWKVRAKDGAGNYTDWVWGSSFNNNVATSGNTSTLAAPTNLEADVYIYSAAPEYSWAFLKWDGVSSTTGVTYELAYKKANDASFTVLSGLSYSFQIVDFPEQAYYTWKVRAVDAQGNTSAWVWGKSFHTIVDSADEGDPELAVLVPSASPSLDRELAVSAGVSYLQAEAGSVAAPLASCGLNLSTDAAQKSLAQSMLA